MRTLSTVIGTLGLAATLIPASVSAQSSSKTSTAPILHVNDAYSTCFFDLHPELTKEEFNTFAAELGSILRFRQLGDSATLGKGKVDISMQYASTPIDVPGRLRRRPCSATHFVSAPGSESRAGLPCRGRASCRGGCLAGAQEPKSI